MKDLTISGARIRRELRWFLAAFVLANLMNVYAIIAYQTAWKELITTIGYVVFLSIVLYLLMAFVRWIVGSISKMSRRKRVSVKE